MNDITFAIHAGAGSIKKEDIEGELYATLCAALEQALMLGVNALKAGKSSVDAVENAIISLENEPLFNAGKGSTLTSQGTFELDACIMRGSDQSAGSICTAETIKNPILAARAVLEKSTHVLITGGGADTFAEECGLETVHQSYFATDMRRMELERILAFEKEGKAWDNNCLVFKKDMGTVGAVARDLSGDLAAGTSTGGIPNKKIGRVGDSPIVGAGTYANNKSCAISATGHGEYFLRLVLAKDISARMGYLDESIQAAAANLIHKKLTQLGGKGGVIGIDSEGNFACEYNTEAMFRAWYTPKTGPMVKIFE